MCSRKIPSLVVFAVLLFVLAPLPARAGPIVVDEASLSSTGTPYQANRAPDGRLVVSIDGARQIWRIDPTTGAYTIYQAQYPDIDNLSDAHADGAGTIWFASWTIGRLGRIASGSLTLWDLASDYPSGVAIDDWGQVWVTDSGDGTLYRFKPGAGVSGQLTCYFLPTSGVSNYVLASGNQLWLGDALNGRIVRIILDAGNPGQGTVWEVPGAKPEGMALDGSGRLWWADTALNLLARLKPDDPSDPGADPLTRYVAPVAASNPLVVQVSGNKVWYTDDGSGTIGLLDPGLASGTTISAPSSPGSLTERSSCGGPVTGKPGSLGISTGSLSSLWTLAFWSSAAEGNGWSVYRLPTTGKPYGIAVVGDTPWVVDQGRRKIARAVHRTYLPMIVRQ